ncbi:MAG: V4R domain-containing protein [Anaerolineae bacterium]
MPELRPVIIPEDAPYVNALFYQMIRGVEEVLGTNGLNAVLRLSGLERYIGNPPPNNLEFGILASEYARLNEAIEEFTGRAGKGMLHRIGRAAFRWGVREQSAVMGLAGIAMKALPIRLRKRAILLAIRKGLMDVVEYGLIDVREEEGVLIFSDYACTICHLRHSDDQPICHQYVGSLAEAMAYATGKDFREFDVVETHCRARGEGVCRFEIRDKR